MLDLDFCRVDEILNVRKALRRELLAREGLQDLRLAVLGGSTTNEIVNLLELLLLSNGFRPVFYQSEYGRYYEEAIHDSAALIEFAPDIIYIHTSYRDVRNAPPLQCNEEGLPGYVTAELARYREIWSSLEEKLGCQIIQNNFEMPPFAPLGNMDAVSSAGESRFLMQLNAAFAQEASGNARLVLQDVCGLSARFGLDRWFDWNRYFSYKILLTSEANLELARSLNALVRAMYGKSRKVLVLDLDNTLWGGVIGDDGVEKIEIGRETPVAEAYTAFQEYCLALRNRGILLAVCSKNDDEIAKAGFAHPSSVLKLEHFSSFKANWEPKPDNILVIAKELNLGVDSFVFVDDNPAERAIVAAQVPGVAVPDIGDEVVRYVGILNRGRYFEPVSLSEEDMQRAAQYAGNSQRAALQTKFSSYGEYLDSLEMVAEIAPFEPVYMDRITQLTNKTNQFNLTTRRYTLAEMNSVANNEGFLGLYGRLVDRFGDNGLISVVLGRKEASGLHLDLWLMSCRVLKRDLELAMLDSVAERAAAMNIRTVYGYYLPTSKNAMVADFYPNLGFSPFRARPENLHEEATVWTLDLTEYRKRNQHIKIVERING